MVVQNLFRYNFVLLKSKFAKAIDLTEKKSDKTESLNESTNNNAKDNTATSETPSTQLCFLLGSPRSGTTLTSSLLDKSDKIFSPPELYLASFEDLAQRKTSMKKTVFRPMLLGLVQCVSRLTGSSLATAMASIRPLEKKSLDIPQMYELLTNRTKAPVFIDKTPCYLTYISDELYKNRFPNAKYLYMYRHPISAILSQKKWMDEISDKTVKKHAINNEKDFLKGKTNYGSCVLSTEEQYRKFETYKNDCYKACDYDKFKMLEAGWFYENNNTLQYLDGIPAENKFIFSFESLLKNPAETLGEILAFLGLDTDPQDMIDKYESNKAPDTVTGIIKATWNMDIGDPNQIFMVGKIDGSRANGSKKHVEYWDKLSDDTKALALKMGYLDPKLQEKAQQENSSKHNAASENKPEVTD